MWRAISLFVLCVVCLISISGQTVIENETSVIVNEKTADVTLNIDNPRQTFNDSISLELLDEKGITRGSLNSPQTIKSGKNAYNLTLPIGELSLEDNRNLVWYRLRYRVGDTRGIISLSEILKNIFELRVIATDNLLAGMNYRVRVRALNPVNLQAIDKVQVTANLKLEFKDIDAEPLTLESNGETDAEGFANLNFQIPIEANLDDADIKITGKKNGIIREADDNLQTVGDDYQFLMMTDKPIYQPEQNLSVRGILTKGGEGKMTVANAELEFRIEDEDNTVLYLSLIHI